MWQRGPGNRRSLTKGPRGWSVFNNPRIRSRRHRSTRQPDAALLLDGTPWRGRSLIARFGPPLLLFAAIAGAVWLPQGTPASTVSGRPQIIDGDTLELNGERVRILDIDAPESQQNCERNDGVQVQCGQVAAGALMRWIGLRPVTCDLFERDRYGRWLGRCLVDGEDIARWLADQGLAVPYRNCACIAIRGLSLYAQWNGEGIWGTEFQAPWEWRAANR
jgi:succinoglycan biosynthesis protein ExoI